MTTDELRAKFEAFLFEEAWLGEGDVVDYTRSDIGRMFASYQAAHASRDAEVEALRDLILDREATIEIREHEVEASRKDVERVNHLALHPRGAKIVIAGMPQDCIFWGISSAPNNTLREAIDAAMREVE